MTKDVPEDLPDAEPDDAPQTSEAPPTLAVIRAERPQIDPLHAQTQKALADVHKAQGRLVAIAGGALVGAVIAALLTGLVGMRAVADLREAGEVQAAANKVLIERFSATQDTMVKADAALTALTAFDAQIGQRIDDLGVRLIADLERVAIESTSMQPQIAAAIQEHVDTALAQTEADLLSALVDLQAKAPPAKPVEAAPKPVVAPAPKPKPKAATPAARPKPQPAPKTAPPPFSYP